MQRCGVLENLRLPLLCGFVLVFLIAPGCHTGARSSKKSKAHSQAPQGAPSDAAAKEDAPSGGGEKAATAPSGDTPEASSSRKIVVLDLRGPRASRIRRYLESAAKDDFELVSRSKYRRTARRLKARGGEPETVAQVAQALGIDAVVDADVVRRKKKGLAVQVRVRDGKTGKVVDTFEVEIARRTKKPESIALLRGALLASLQNRRKQSTPVEPPAAADEPPVAVEKTTAPVTEEDSTLPPERFEEKTDTNGHVLEDEDPVMHPSKYH